jgi:hypothetical protein
MSLVGRHFKSEGCFGPYIVMTTISDELHKILLDTAYKIKKNKKLKKENDYRYRLAGNIAEEYSYTNAFTPRERAIANEELNWCVSQYTKLSKQYLGRDLGKEPNEIIMLEPLWVNFMKQAEWNPSHNHTGDISMVTYLKVPKEISEENTKEENVKKVIHHLLVK